MTDEPTSLPSGSPLLAEFFRQMLPDFAREAWVDDTWSGRYTPQARSHEAGFIYACTIVDTPYIKVGYTTSPMQHRLIALRNEYRQFVARRALAFLGAVDIMEALVQTEHQLHKLLQPYQVQGEWYDMPWDFERFCQLVQQAHVQALESAIFRTPSRPYLAWCDWAARERQAKRPATAKRYASYRQRFY